MHDGSRAERPALDPSPSLRAPMMSKRLLLVLRAQDSGSPDVSGDSRASRTAASSSASDGRGRAVAWNARPCMWQASDVVPVRPSPRGVVARLFGFVAIVWIVGGCAWAYSTHRIDDWLFDFALGDRFGMDVSRSQRVVVDLCSGETRTVLEVRMRARPGLPSSSRRPPVSPRTLSEAIGPHRLARWQVNQLCVALDDSPFDCETSCAWVTERSPLRPSCRDRD